MKITPHILKTFIGLLCILSVKTGFAQNVGISSTSSFVPDASAALDVSYASKGLLIPRVALTAANVAGPITTPATSLLVYNTATAGTSPNNVIPGYYYWNGSAWIMLSTSAQTATSSWSSTGNTGTSYLTNFLGTTDNNSLRIRTNNVARAIIDSIGNVGIGNTAPTQKLDISGNLKFSGALMPNNSAGTAGYFLMTNGSGTAPTWFNANNLITTQAWGLSGNTGTTPTTNFLGTVDNKPMRFRTNNTQRMLLDSLGNVGIGTSPTFSSNMEKLLVDAGTTSSFNVISGKGNLNSYLQLNIQNNNAGAAASSDVVATADNGNESANYVDMGINSSVNTAANFGAANDAYLYNAGGTVGGNFFIGTSTAGKVLGFLTGGGATTNERMRIDGSGNVGIGTTNPSAILHLNGTNPLKINNVATGTNTTADSLLTITNGLVRKLPISTFTAGGTDWLTTGNTGTTAGTNFIGTTDAIDFVAKTNNAERLRISSAGDVLIGGTAFNSSNPEQLLVDAGTTSSSNVISGKGTINNFLQLNIQNLSAGLNASSDVVATADNGTDAANYVDMGINSSGNKNTFYFGLANDAYLYNVGGSVGGNFYMGNSTSGKVLAFLTGGSAASNERMRIDGTGNVGIGTTAPSQKLDVNGSINASTSIYLDAANANTGTKAPGLIFGSNGSGESIASKRTSGTNQYGIDFYTSSANRMSVTNSGNIGIGTNTPAATLDVEGTTQLGVGGTAFSNLMRGSFTINNTTSFNASDKITSTVTINGVTTGANVLINPTAPLPGAIAIASVRVSAANTIIIAFVNTSTTNNTVGQVTFNYTIIQ